MDIRGINKKESLVLFSGDILFFTLALFLTLLFRYAEIPTQEIFFTHLLPFSFLFLVWVVVFFIAGLYGKHTLLFKSRLPGLLLNTQITNSALAVLFFYFVSVFGVAPKTNLFLYLIISFFLILFWRTKIVPLFGFRRRQRAILIGSSTETRELEEEVNENVRYPLIFSSVINLEKIEQVDIDEDILKEVFVHEVSLIVVDLRNEKIEKLLPHLYNLIFANVRFIDMYKVYEDIFDRVPLSLLHHGWFLQNISFSSHRVYDILKHSMDFSVAFVLGLVTLCLSPFVALAVKLDDRGSVFIAQERVGKGSRTFKMYKFRTMTEEETKERRTLTRVGNFLRKSRIDELPQAWNILRGDLSLIGPRPELPEFVKIYQKEIPYYNIRHLIEPGLSGWAQIYHEKHPHHHLDMDETKNKLSYDLYYIKNRSLLLDLKIALLTIKTFFSRSGR